MNLSHIGQFPSEWIRQLTILQFSKMGGVGEGKTGLPEVIVCKRNAVRPRTESVIGVEL